MCSEKSAYASLRDSVFGLREKALWQGSFMSQLDQLGRFWPLLICDNESLSHFGLK